MYEDFAQLYDNFMYDVDYNTWAAYLLEVWQSMGMDGPQAILDAACGTGSISVPLSSMGHTVTGADISTQMLERAGAKARQAGRRIPFIAQDMRSLELHRQVDVVNSTLDGVNYLLTDDDVRAFFRSALNALRPGGVLTFDISSYFKLKFILGYNCFGEDNADEAYIWRNLFDDKTALLHSDLTMFRRRGRLYERFFEQHTQKAHKTQDILGLLAQCGFSDARCYTHLTFEPPKEDSERILFAARKPWQ